MSTTRNCLALVILFTVVGSPALSQDDNPRHLAPQTDINQFRTLSQNWSHDESNWFYDVPQGSQLLPYKWFLHLEQQNSEQLFRSAENFLRLGYIPRLPHADSNPDGLPIGFVRDAAYPNGEAALGLTCAACHTTQINYKKTAIIVDGGPTLGDFETLLRELVGAMNATASDEDKFSRFAAAVLPADSSTTDQQELRQALRKHSEARAAYNKRNLSAAGHPPFGPGRVDAFGAIFNEVAVTFLKKPHNWHVANAPVSYPFLWDAPQHDKVQWNGAAENTVNPLGTILVGTEHIGALGRNAGEVLGVFGSVDVPVNEVIPQRYPSTVHTGNLIAIEDSLSTLWSPQWPEDVLGLIDDTAQQKGMMLFRQHCSSCHDQDFQRDDPNRKVVAQLKHVGTDMTVIQNFGHSADTGVLKNRLKTLFTLQTFNARASIGEILRHMVQRAILAKHRTPDQLKQQIAAAQAQAGQAELTDQVDAGFQMTARIQLGDQELVGKFNRLQQDGTSLLIDGGLFRTVPAKDGQPSDSAQLDLRSAEGIDAAAKQWKNIAANAPTSETSQDSDDLPDAVIQDATVEIGYKARPLNGIWATAPYLHNGSVPSLAEMLKSPADRSATFHIGGLEFDPVNVGYVQDPTSPVFDTQHKGNHNTGHDFGTGLSETEKKQLIEYLKSL